jgi:hypothetical protein
MNYDKLSDDVIDKALEGADIDDEVLEYIVETLTPAFHAMMLQDSKGKDQRDVILVIDKILSGAYNTAQLMK